MKEKKKTAEFRLKRVSQEKMEGQGKRTDILVTFYHEKKNPCMTRRKGCGGEKGKKGGKETNLERGGGGG